MYYKKQSEIINDLSDATRLWNMAGATGLEPATSCVTGRRSNQTELHPRFKSNGGR